MLGEHVGLEVHALADHGRMNVGSLALVCLVSMSFAPVRVQNNPAQGNPTQAQSRVLEQLQGAWRLRKIEDKQLASQRRQETGYMVVSGSHVALEIHVGYTQDNGLVGQPIFQTGIYASSIDKELNLVLNTLIGSNTDSRFKASAEQVGKQRKYTVDIVGAMLTLRREDGAQFLFDRLADNVQRYDFYGRKLADPKEGPVKNP